MAQEEKKETYFDAKQEDGLADMVIRLGTVTVDEQGREVGGDEDTVWTIFNTKDANVDVIYRQDQGTGLTTIKGTTKLKISLEDIYEFLDPSSDDEQKFNQKVDDLLESWRLVKNIDSDHRCVYTQFSTGFPSWMIWPRDFCIIKRRIKFDNYKVGNETFNIVLNLNYSIKEDHPLYEPVAKSHVRGHLFYSGYIFMKNVNDKEADSCTLTYVLNLSPGGKIPQKVVNYTAPAQGMNVKGYSDNIEFIKELLAKRKKAKVE